MFRIVVSQDWPTFSAFRKDGLQWPEAYENANRDMYKSLAYSHGGTSFQDPELHLAMQDLGWMIGYDLTEACESFNDPDLYYPGVDDGIEPVSDEHVDKVIAALQRELNRELRTLPGSSYKRPAVPLADLQPRIKRAIAERRRLRYKQWGLGKKQFESGTWSLWDVPEDPDWIPPWI